MNLHSNFRLAKIKKDGLENDRLTNDLTYF